VAEADTTTIAETNAVEKRKGVVRETDTTREIETETGTVVQAAQEIETGAETDQTDRKTGERMEAGAGIAGIETTETKRELEIKTVSVAGTVAATASTRKISLCTFTTISIPNCCLTSMWTRL
jgi:hypothetical protein